MTKIKKYLSATSVIMLLLLTSCSYGAVEEAETAYINTQRTEETTLLEAASETVQSPEETTLSETSSEVVQAEETVAATEITATEEAEALSVCKCQYEWQHAYSKYLNGLDWLSGGVYLGDINGDEIPEAVVEKNIYEFTHVLYYNDSGLQLLPLETKSQWGDVTYISDTKQILYTPMYGHTMGTWGYVECYLYSWDGTDYVEDISLYRKGEQYYDSNGELQQFFDDAFINGELVDNDTFEAEDNKLTALANENSYFPIVNVTDEDFENYVKENFPCFNNWDIIHVREW